MKTADLAALMDAALMGGALPGEDEGFGAAQRSDAAHFVARAMERRDSGSPALLMEPMTDVTGQRMHRLAVINDDMPFLVDSVAQALAADGVHLYRLIHPVVQVVRDAKGVLTSAVNDTHGEGKRESVIYIEMAALSAKVAGSLPAKMTAVLTDVRAATGDWMKMKVVLSDAADSLPDGEGAALLRWLLDDHFTLLGSETRAVDGTRRDCLGLARAREGSLISDGGADLAAQWFADGRSAPLMLKSNHVSTVHRHVLLDLIVVPLRTDGAISGLTVITGLWTSNALATPPQKVPLMRAQLAQMLDTLNLDAKGHAGKSLVHAMTHLPHDVMIGFPAEEQQRVALTAVSLSDRPRPKLLLLRSPLRRHVFAFVWLPRDDVSTGMRHAIAEMLTTEAKANVLAWSIALEDGQVALIRFTLDLTDRDVVLDETALDAKLKRLVRGWAPAVEAALTSVAGEDAIALASRFVARFPNAYRYDVAAEEAALDIMRLAALEDGARDVDVRLHHASGDHARKVRLKVYHTGGPLPLSRAVPALENFGFVVEEEKPTALAEAEGHAAYIHDFTLDLGHAGDAAALLAQAAAMEAAIAAVLTDQAENDGFNALMTTAGLAHDSVVWLRAWFRYLRQTGIGYSIQTIIAALSKAPDAARALVRLFVALHDPKSADAKAADAARADFDAALVKVTAIDDDRILRLFRSLIEAMLRTNVFADGGNEALAFKLDSAKVPGLPKPLPWREIFVYSPRVEGIHLRAGPVARGGLRWSDRRDDFRTEVLGLMKAQRVKNAVIVPTGAKGGFYPKQLPDPAVDRDAWAAEGKASYQVFIRALLSITDNLDGDTILPPSNVRRLDDDDPYFVVAADKGTATYSDTANALAEERDFWLGDAFASGGSNGYDHKAMGITARGAWLSVQRHFAEMGVDVQSDPVRVAGVGDMSGDVFGNGMLLSQSIHVVAAFDHRHIFIDPTPDAAKSWAERNRLFALPRSSWADYDASLISNGGGVFARSEKSLPLTDEIRALTGLTGDTTDPQTLMTAILKAPVDLMWFGGIGTYVKAAAQSHADVGDPANDRIRINGDELGAKVVGEGANLGVTQAGRIEFALSGGRINTDFIDNSAGVDCSDNEVNIKIALNTEMRAGTLAEEARNVLLASMTDEVADLVLGDNRAQALALSIAETGGVAAVPSYVRLIERFEATGRLDRKVEGLTGDDVLLRRAQDGFGLQRPELAVLLSTAKLALQEAIEQCELGLLPEMEADLIAAFPPTMQGAHREAILTHRLRGEIVATKLSNRIINRLGPLYPYAMADEEGAALSDLAEAFWVIETLYDLKSVYARIDGAVMAEPARLMLYDRMARAVRDQMADLIRTGLVKGAPAALVATLRPGFDALSGHVDDLLNPDVRAALDADRTAMLAAGVPEAMAGEVVKLRALDGLFGIAELAARRGVDPVTVAAAFTEVGEVLDIDWVGGAASSMQPTDAWERLLLAGVTRDLHQIRLEFLGRAKGGDFTGFVTNWAKDEADRIAEFRNVVARAHNAAEWTVPMLSQIAQHARLLLGR